MEQNQSVDVEKKKYESSCSSSSFWGISLIVMGLYFLGRELGWFDYDFPFWAIFMILAGLWMVVGGLKK